jgi:hypothetical protein
MTAAKRCPVRRLSCVAFPWSLGWQGRIVYTRFVPSFKPRLAASLARLWYTYGTRSPPSKELTNDALRHRKHDLGRSFSAATAPPWRPMTEPPERLAIVVQELHVAVPLEDFAHVRQALRDHGLVIRNLDVGPSRAGLVVHAEKVVELDLSRVRMRRRTERRIEDPGVEPGLTPELDDVVLEGLDRQIRAEMHVMSQGRPPSRLWLKVFSTRMAPTGYELHVVDERDADHQLEVLAQVTRLSRDNITICPRRGWEGYL